MILSPKLTKSQTLIFLFGGGGEAGVFFLCDSEFKIDKIPQAHIFGEVV